MNSSTKNYTLNIVQTNGCRTWTNPTAIEPPMAPIELFIRQLPANCTEQEILPFFDRFGEIYEFRLLVGYDGTNRGFAYLIYNDIKPALMCLDCMGYFIIRSGILLDVTKSEQKSSLVALGIPPTVSDDAIEIGFRQTFWSVQRVLVQRQDNEVAAILSFGDHESALQVRSYTFNI